MLWGLVARRSTLTGVVAMMVMFLLIGMSTLSCGTPAFDEDTRSDLDAVVEKVMKANQIPGANIGVWVPGKGDWVVARGKADMETGRAMRITDKFRIASITKTFTSTMVLQLVDEGALELDGKLAENLPEVPFSDEVTIRQLLNHTAGIVDDDENVDDVVESNPLKKWTPMEVIEAYTGGKLGDEPGNQIRYSNAGYVILGLLIERVGGGTVNSVLQEKIAGPLGLENTYFPEGPDITGEYAHGYDGTRDVTRIDMSWDWTAGAMISTLDDLRTWARALAEGTLLSGKMHEAQLTLIDFPRGKGQIKYGLGIYYEFGFLGHDGANIGYQTDMMYLPEKDATIVILFNKLSGDTSDLNATEKAFVGIADIVLPGSIPAWYRDVFDPPATGNGGE